MFWSETYLILQSLFGLQRTLRSNLTVTMLIYLFEIVSNLPLLRNKYY